MTSPVPLRAALAASWIAAACACLAPDAPPTLPAGPDSRAQDSAQTKRIDSLRRANDSLYAALQADGLRTRDRLLRLAAAIPRLPVPVGTRYFAAPGSSAGAMPKPAAAAACKGPMDVFALDHAARGVLGIDTVMYFDSLDSPHCVQQALTTRETHARYLLDPACGQAWERMEIAIAPDDAYPRYRTHGTGTVLTNGGEPIAIEDYESDMALENATRTPIWFDARMRLATRDGLRIDLALIAPHPFRAQDFFPIWDAPASAMVMMQGPIRSSDTIVGYLDLYADRTVAVRDAAGRPLP